ncbi:MAG TPA: DUF1499 domain-containing protein [Pseudomonadales bacterium]|nr:DUF1499 domain-containing protein [Pseudomonadales bacterium]
MENVRWWSWLLLVSAIVAVVLLVTAPFGYKYHIFALGPSFISLLIALAAAVLVLLGSLVMLVVASRQGLTRNRTLVVLALVLSIFPIGFMAPQMIKARSAAPIHDISTDTVNPPQFDKIVAMRKGAANSLKYGAGKLPMKDYVALQEKVYPNVKSLHTDLSVADAVVHAKDILSAQGLDVVNVDANKGIVEATATTFWFGFKDDLVVRVTPADKGSTVDVRSVSRVGISDLGVNAKRIVKLLHAF